MSAFKDAVAADIKSTFINALEFADTHNIDGTDVLCVVDSDILQERSSKAASEYAEGVFRAQILVYIAKEDLPVRPVYGEVIRLDGDLYLVQECIENMGVLEITIEANDT